MRDVQSRLVVLSVAFGPALLLAVVAATPGLNFLYSGHGGPAWFMLPLAFPFTLFVLWLSYRASSPQDRPVAKRVALISIGAYVPISLLASFAGAHSIRATFGLNVDPLQLWALFLSPFGFPA